MSEVRLIDANALKPKIDKFIGYLDEDMIERIKVVIDNAPTVDIPNYGGQVVPDTLQGWRYEERPQGDLISRSTLKNMFDKPFWEQDLASIYHTIDNAPTVEINTNEIEYKAYCKGLEDGKKIARPQGEWIARNDGTHYCSNCRGDAIDGDFDEIITTFCPHCGAEMKGGAE